MNKSNPTITWALALAFGTLASIQLGAKPRVPAQMAAPTAQQQKPATKTARSYACPMHPEVKSTRKGKCPKCKMDLQLVRESPSSADKEKLAASAGVLTANVNSSASAGVPGNVLEQRKKMIIPDVEVLDQEGNAIHFYSDLIKGKTVAINFIFTNCTTICPPLAATFARVQKEMGDKVGKDVHFISLSVDPLTDTPERLKAWAAKFKAGAGWTFVTGNKLEMDKLLYALGASVSRREDHTPSVIIGNELKGVWTRTYGLARTSQMVGLIENVIEGRLDESQSATEPAKP
jgi:cytochrome oxidase Cu insertion factor (SCO1/SenC/PrrC family)